MACRPGLDWTHFMSRPLQSTGWTTFSAGTASTSPMQCCAVRLSQSAAQQALNHLSSARHSNSLRSKQMRTPNAIIEELHEVREAIAEASDNDLKKIAEAARARQTHSGHEVVRLPPRPPVGSAKKAS